MLSSAKTAVYVLALLGAVIASGAETKSVPLSKLEVNRFDLGFILAKPGDPVPAEAMRIAGRQFGDGILADGASRLEVALDGNATTFRAWVGVSDDVRRLSDGVSHEGPAEFEIFGDDRLLATISGMMKGDAARGLSVPLAGLRKLVMVISVPDFRVTRTVLGDAMISYNGRAPEAVALAAGPAEILTPPPPRTPRINGAKVFGVRPGSPFLFTIAATGDRPMSFSAEKLPAGLQLDPSSGRITGAVTQRGEYRVLLTARNELGSTTRELRIVVGDTLALTPPMGWNSWNCFERHVTEADVRTAADTFVKSGLINHGWTYINIDDYWQSRPRPGDEIEKEIDAYVRSRGGKGFKLDSPSADPTLVAPARDEFGRIAPNRRFTDMKALVDYIHGLGLKAGIYSSPGPLTCGGCIGSYGHELQDATQFAEWGFDFLKYDWCSYGRYALDRSRTEYVKPFRLMADSLRVQKRDIVFSLCQYGMDNVWEWGAVAGANLWRTTGDIQDCWASMSGIGFAQDGHGKFSGPGHWNDQDMMVLGYINTLMEYNYHFTRLTPDEQYTHFSLWCLQAAPLIIGCDMAKLDDFTLGLLTNDEVIAIDQDPLGRGADRIRREGHAEIWARPLEDGSMAVGLFNRGELPLEITVNWFELGIAGGQIVRDSWRQKDIGHFENTYTAKVPRHGVKLIKMTPTSQTQP